MFKIIAFSCIVFLVVDQHHDVVEDPDFYGNLFVDSLLTEGWLRNFSKIVNSIDYFCDVGL